jgi:hypothetical protein
MLYHSAAPLRPDRVQRGRRDSVDDRTLTSLVKLAIGVGLARAARVCRRIGFVVFGVGCFSAAWLLAPAILSEHFRYF